ncbi:MAG: bifunctional adenosylcobinamide kinase/adenosylcobinamide-phosphate guanylyltransferase [Acidobacteria bacterium]|nr:bifunctional adenosylcobinamide kinase/adenosylcobinamide-phosphate guanylyltransferase [Acidobacteriota bacterium]
MLTLVLGGARSGKSRYAQSLCAGHPVVYVATAQVAGDPDMQQRIDRHRRDRPASWTTVEEPTDVASAVLQAQPRAALVMVDCVTVWISNLLWTYRDATTEDQERAVLQAVADLGAVGRARRVIAVSNEVGGGTVPGHPVARRFRDVHGLANQLLAREAGRVVLVVAGLALVLKDDGEPPLST